MHVKSMKKLYVLIILSSLGMVLCEKTAPSDLNSVKDTKHKDDRSIEFLHEIKEGLRRNNDDYADAKAKSLSTKEAQFNVESNLKFHNKKDNPNSIIDDIERRAYEGSFSEENFKTTDKEIQTILTSTKSTQNRYSIVTQTTTPNIGQSQINQENMNKLKMFFQKNTGLVKQFVSNKGIGTILKMPDRGKQTIRMKAQESDKEIHLPKPKQLDMAPAKGGHIHMLRIKGRLCQRNVLIPEGPKYDSKGEIYLPAFTSASRHKQFEKTIPPKLILPKCCNCCKKSVLGCE